MRLPILTLALTVLVLTGPRPVAAQATRALSGCYEFPAGGAQFSWDTYEPWSRTFAVHQSPYIEFTQTPGKRAGTFLLRAPGMRDTSGQSELAERVWERIAPDSIALTWGNGFSGMRMRLHIRGDTLDGTVLGFSDVVPGVVRVERRGDSLVTVGTEGERRPRIVPLPAEGFRVPCPTAPPRGGAT